MPTIGSRLLACSLTVMGGCGEAQAPSQPEPDPPSTSAAVPLVLRNVQVLPMTSAEIAGQRTVVIAGGRVTAIGDPFTQLPDGAVVIEGRGRYLLPALIDMHVHIKAGDLSTYLHYGITTVRNMWGWPGLKTLMAQIEQGELSGPRIISASQGLDDEPVQWPSTRIVHDSAAEAAAVREQLEAGWSFLKVYDRLSRASYAAVLAEAAARGATVVGHVPFGVQVEDAITMGQHSIEHLTGYDRRVSRSRRSGTWGWIDADPGLYAGLARLSQEKGVWNCPTLAIFVALSNQHSPAERQTIITQRRRFVSELHQAGALLLAGSDAGIDVVAPGASLHDELAELALSGLSPYEALRAATIDAGRFLGIDLLGTVAVGAPADFLLLDGNPLEDLGRLRHFAGLIQGGAWSAAGSLPP